MSISDGYNDRSEMGISDERRLNERPTHRPSNHSPLAADLIASPTPPRADPASTWTVSKVVDVRRHLSSPVPLLNEICGLWFGPRPRGGSVETKVRTPHEVFFMPQRLLVPLFQRPYVWTRENQWTVLWDDIRRHAELRLSTKGSSPHFLGAVVLQNQSASVGNLPYWTIIDGQQRLTTMQLLLDAAHQSLSLVGSATLARQVEDLIGNPEHFCRNAEDRFKVWPTNRDRAAFNDVMAAELPVDYAGLPHRSSRMTQAHQFFSEEMTAW